MKIAEIDSGHVAELCIVQKYIDERLSSCSLNIDHTVLSYRIIQLHHAAIGKHLYS